MRALTIAEGVELLRKQLLTILLEESEEESFDSAEEVSRIEAAVKAATSAGQLIDILEDNWPTQGTEFGTFVFDALTADESAEKVIVEVIKAE
jgi:hypothetical protein